MIWAQELLLWFALLCFRSNRVRPRTPGSGPPGPLAAPAPPGLGRRLGRQRENSRAGIGAVSWASKGRGNTKGRISTAPAKRVIPRNGLSPRPDARPGPEPPPAPFCAGHDVMWHGIALWLRGVTCPGWVPSQLPVERSPVLAGARDTEDREARFKGKSYCRRKSGSIPLGNRNVGKCFELWFCFLFLTLWFCPS